jgi:hypothetical protein
MATTRRAFTLIELLVVIAIIENPLPAHQLFLASDFNPR